MRYANPLSNPSPADTCRRGIIYSRDFLGTPADCIAVTIQEKLFRVDRDGPLRRYRVTLT